MRFVQEFPVCPHLYFIEKAVSWSREILKELLWDNTDGKGSRNERRKPAFNRLKQKKPGELQFLICAYIIRKMPLVHTLKLRSPKQYLGFSRNSLDYF